VGPGQAYDTPLRSHVMNTPTAYCNIVADDPQHLQRWLERTRRNDAEERQSRFLPRLTYGTYLADTTDEAAEILRAKGHRVQVVRERICDLWPTDDGQMCLRSAVSTHRAERVILAIGDAKPRALPGIPAGCPGFFDSPWPFERTRTIPAESSVLLAGMGASALDTCLWLDACGHRGSITLTSRGGLLPCVLREKSIPTPENMHEQFDDALLDTGPHIPLHRFVEAMRADLVAYLGSASCLDRRSLTSEQSVAGLRKEIAAAHGGERLPQDYFRSLRSNAAAFWERLSDLDRERFDREYSTIWNYFRHPVALPLAERLLELLAEGRVAVAAGVEQLSPVSNGFVACLRGGVQIFGSYLVNATGFDLDATRSTDPLIGKLLGRCLAVPHPRGGLRVDETFRLEGGSYEIYLLGSLTRGSRFTSPSIQAVRDGALRIVKSIRPALGLGNVGGAWAASPLNP
jgi:uncharacterized NAD(P)/FAD-binding protein YdhS